MLIDISIELPVVPLNMKKNLGRIKIIQNKTIKVLKTKLIS